MKVYSFYILLQSMSLIFKRFYVSQIVSCVLRRNFAIDFFADNLLCQNIKIMFTGGNNGKLVFQKCNFNISYLHYFLSIKLTQKCQITFIRIFEYKRRKKIMYVTLFIFHLRFFFLTSSVLFYYKAGHNFSSSNRRNKLNAFGQYDNTTF